jgi:hypothetical protein
MREVATDGARRPVMNCGQFDARQYRVAHGARNARRCLARTKSMLNLIPAATARVFFAVAIRWAYACDRL